MYSLVGVDGNAFFIMSYVARAMKREGFLKNEIDEYYTRAKSGDYSNLVTVSDDYVQMCNSRARKAKTKHV